jgi:hypothetical protein
MYGCLVITYKDEHPTVKPVRLVQSLPPSKQGV